MVKVDGRYLASNGCGRCKDCFNCKLPDCVANTQEILIRDSCSDLEEAERKVQRYIESNNKSRKRGREKTNNG